MTTRPTGIRIRRGGSDDAAARAFVAAHERVGLDGVRGALGRRGRGPGIWLPGRAVDRGMRWDRHDTWTEDWYPQGVSTAADAGCNEPLVLVSWNSTRGLGCRLTIVDLARRRYEHVLLVAPDAERPEALPPLHAHAGGIAWTGDHVHIAATGRGVVLASLDDIVRLDEPQHGCRFALPAQARWASHADDGHERLRFSFVGIDRSGTHASIVAGEHGEGDATTRLTRFVLDGAMQLPDDEPPVSLGQGVERMQGAAHDGERWFVSASNGQWRRGSIWVGEPGALVEHRAATPPGPEDLSMWRSQDRLWSVSEFPGRRWLFSMPASAFRAAE